MMKSRNHTPISCASVFVTLILSVLIFDSSLQAVSLRPDVLERMRADGTLDKYVQDMQNARSKGVWGQGDKSFKLSTSADATPDTMRIVVILVDFSDNVWTSGPDGTLDYFEDLIFSDGVLPKGSMKEFYIENSYGNFVLAGEVYGWYRMPQTYAYYVDGQRGFGTYPQNAQKLAEDAVNVANGDIDYSLYDNDGDGYVEGLMLVHAGEGYETSGNLNQIHSHRWFMHNAQSLDGVFLNGYAIQPEQTSGGDGLIDIGVFCHEFGHVLGLPDLYDTDYSSAGLGDWTLMASGSYNGGSMNPAHLDAWCKKELGWITLENITVNEIGHEFPRSEETPYAARIWMNGSAGSQYFLVENRQRVLFDANIPGEGLLIYHIDETQSGNQNENHYLVALEQADGLFELEHNTGQGNSGDPYPGSTDAREFTDLTTPNSRDYPGVPTEVAVWSISDSDSLMTANLDINYSRPLYILESHDFDDTAGGDGDGISELGETIDFYFSVSNIWAEATNVTADLAVNDPRIIFTVPSINLGTISSGGNANNNASPLQFQVPSDMDTLQLEFYLTITQDGAVDTTLFTFEHNVGGVAVLIVDDDRSDIAYYEHYLTDVLDSLALTYDVWDKKTKGSPGVDQEIYPTVMWLTGDHRDTTLVPDDRTFIKNYLDAGGHKLFITGQDIAQHLSSTDPDMLSDYFHCSYGGSLVAQYMVRGAAGSYIGRTDSLIITGTDDGAANQASADWLIPADATEICFRYLDGSAAALEISEQDYRAVFFGFGFEAVNSTYTGYNFESRLTVMRRILKFFDLADEFICGDANNSGEVDIDDAIYLIAYSYLSGPAPIPVESGDLNCDGKINLLDIVGLVNYLFRGGPVPCSSCP
ncbi:MAG: M6 family metalloprotease domain-containing protein [candidate division Zixibacteria bacterium]|nr:M6 family metalloprotease domain-containing protein [candidate division Zixibacteria bacterium]MBU1469345.1 M6 family metalloprotease domain-containing protein [candidate division Zixibacteria bacterium]MBU2626507.1 M6 family metalloprotease domain-containing protein [candidate division Zixibacteria bacterium]